MRMAQEERAKFARFPGFPTKRGRGKKVSPLTYDHFLLKPCRLASSPPPPIQALLRKQDPPRPAGRAPALTCGSRTGRRSRARSFVGAFPAFV